jgi:hypothetical protein
MKKTILSLLCILYSFTGFCGNIENESSVTLLKPIRIRIAFDIAAPRFDCETGFGICKPSGGFGRLGGEGRTVSGEAYIENGVFVLNLQREYITERMQDELTQIDYFNTDDDIAIPQIWLEKMGVNDSYYIPTGKYRIIKYNEYFEINFDLK